MADFDEDDYELPPPPDDSSDSEPEYQQSSRVSTNQCDSIASKLDKQLRLKQAEAASAQALQWSERRGDRPVLPQPCTQKFIAMYDFDARDDHELSLKEGDIIMKNENAEDAGDFVEVVNAEGKQGQVPKNYIEVQPVGYKQSKRQPAIEHKFDTGEVQDKEFNKLCSTIGLSEDAKRKLFDQEMTDLKDLTSVDFDQIKLKLGDVKRIQKWQNSNNISDSTPSKPITNKKAKHDEVHDKKFQKLCSTIGLSDDAERKLLDQAMTELKDLKMADFEQINLKLGDIKRIEKWQKSTDSFMDSVPSKPAHHAKPQSDDEFRQFCLECKLTKQVIKSLTDNGYTDFDDVRDALPEDLLELGIQRPVYRRIQKFIQEKAEKHEVTYNKRKRNQEAHSEDEICQESKNKEDDHDNKMSEKSKSDEESKSDDDDHDEDKISEDSQSEEDDDIINKWNNYPSNSTKGSKAPNKTYESSDDESKRENKIDKSKLVYQREFIDDQEKKSNRNKPRWNQFPKKSSKPLNKPNVRSDVRGKPTVMSPDVKGAKPKKKNQSSKDKFYDIAGEKPGLIRYIARMAKKAIGYGKKSAVEQRGEFTIHRLPLIETYSDSECKIRFSQIGDVEPTSPSKVILLVGSTGCGKSTMIEGMVNYIFGISFEDNYRLTIIDLQDCEQNKSQVFSQTDWITAYTVPCNEHTVTDYPLTIVDMPGFGDTRGIARDEELIKSLKKLFTTKGDCGISTIEAVCFVAKATDIRLTPVQNYIFTSILKIFGKNISQNIHALISFVDNPETDPVVLQALKEAEVPYNKYFKFNNDAVYPKNRSVITGLYWEMGRNGYKNLFRHLKSAKTRSLTLTVETLEQRERIDEDVRKLQKKIDSHIQKIEENNNLEQQLRNELEQKAQNEGYELTIPKDIVQKVPLENNKKIIHCEECHNECMVDAIIDSINNLKQLEELDLIEEGICTACDHDIEYHKIIDFRLETATINKKKIFHEKKESYFKAKEAIVEIETKLKPIQEERVLLEEEVNSLYGKVAKCMKQLDKIALKRSPASNREYLEQLIKQQKQEAGNGYLAKIAMLEDVLKKEQTILEIAAKNRMK